MAEAATKIALLIDADNIDPKFYPEIVESLSARGPVVIRRAYGNPRTWNKKTLHGATLKHALTPILVIPPIETKDAADMRLAIDAVDLIHHGAITGIAIASSDSDFATLAMRIAESGLAVYGFGETKTPEAFRVACTAFVELIQPSARKAPPSAGARAAKPVSAAPRPAPSHPAKPLASKAPHVAPARARATTKPPVRPFPAAEVLEAFDQSVRDIGWASLSDLGRAVAKMLPGFRTTDYGADRLATFLKLDPRFEFNEKGDAVRLKRG